MPGPLLTLPPPRSADFSTTPTGSNSRYTWTAAQATAMGFDVGTGEFTLEYWIFQTAFGGAGTFDEPMGKTNNLGNTGWDLERDNNGSTGFQLFLAGGSGASLPSAAAQTGTWMYNAFARRGSTVDGWYSVGPNGSGGLIKAAGLLTSSSNITSTTILDIGAQSAFGVGSRSRIAVVRWWNRALSDGDFKYYWNRRLMRGVRYAGLRFMFDPTQDDRHSNTTTGIGARNLVGGEVGTSGSLAVVLRSEGPNLIWDFGPDTFADVLARPRPTAFAMAPFIRISPPTGGGATTNTRTVPTSIVASITATRTIPTSVVALVTSTRTVPTSVVARTTNTRTIPTSVVVLQPATRTIPTSMVVQAWATRTIPTSIVVLATLTRTVPTSIVALQVSTRSIPSSLVVLQVQTRTVPTSVVALVTSTRTVPTSVVALQTSTRTIPTSLVASGGSPTRTIPTSVVVLQTSTRTVPTSVVATTLNVTRTIPTSVVALTVRTRTVPTSVVAYTTSVRTVPTSAVVQAWSVRVVPTSIVVKMLNVARTIPTSLVVSAPGSLIPGTVSVMDEQVDPVSIMTELVGTVSITSEGVGTVSIMDEEF